MVYALGALLFLGVVVLLWLMRRDSRTQGTAEEKIKIQQEVTDDVYVAGLARDRLAHDADYARRVRERFERKE